MNFVWILALHHVLGSTDLTAGAATTPSSGHGVGFYIVDGLRAGESHGSTKLMLFSNATTSWNQTKDKQAKTDPIPMQSTQLHQAESLTHSINVSGSTPTTDNLDISPSPTPSAFRPSLNISWPGQLQDELHDDSVLNGKGSNSSHPSPNASSPISSGLGNPANRSDVAADLCWEQWQSLWNAQKPLSAYHPTLAGRQFSLQHRAEKTAPRASAITDSPSSAILAGYSTVATTEIFPIVDAGHTIATEVTTYSVRDADLPTTDVILQLPIRVEYLPFKCCSAYGKAEPRGGTIQLLFWPPGSQHDTTAAPSTLKTLGTILTSPTNYISFKSVSAADACSDVGPTLTSCIIAIPTDASLSTKYGVFDLDSIGSLPLPYVRASTAPLNISNLMLDPVPYSIYASQPWCASHELTQMYRGSQTSCETSRSYSPILVVPDAVLQSLAPEWASCSADLRGLYDPPIALQPVELAASPTLPAVVTSQRPVNGLTTSQVPKTSTAALFETPASLQDDWQSLDVWTSSQAPRPNVVEQVISVITAIMLPSSHDLEDKTASGLTTSRPSAASPSNALDVLQEAQQEQTSLEVAPAFHSHPLPQTITSQTHRAPTLPRVIFTLPPTRFRYSEGSLGSRASEEITVHAGDRDSVNAVVINDQVTVIEGAQATSVGQRQYSLGGSGLVVYDHDSVVTTLALDSSHEMLQSNSGEELTVQDRLVTIYPASASAFVVNGVILSQGGTAFILDDLTLSNAPAGMVAQGSGGFFTRLLPHTGPAANATTSDLETTTRSSSLPGSISASKTTSPASSMSMTTTRAGPGRDTEVPWSELSKASKASLPWLRVCSPILLAVCAAL
ncbi:hypothetical protein HII31_08350 [Pseudocercospora fuligena]|uniref:Uncharacterized protein n=1 Tax=Pseudocercospora fuligena TaxID=685502 RepID=A0A8H6VJ80_9PEZI|nr:hypothetical protein HII31_08350 [Pseudocercospora fuligena]